MKTTFAALAALALISGSAMADDATCNTNWVNGACGTPTSDGGAHKKAEVQSKLREKPCPEHQGKDV